MGGGASARDLICSSAAAFGIRSVRIPGRFFNRSWEMEIQQGPFHMPNEAFGNKASDRSIAWNLRKLSPVDLTVPRTIPFIQSSGAGPACTRRGRPTSTWPSTRIGVRLFPSPFTTYHLAATTSFDDGPKIPATERARRHFNKVEPGHRRPQPCQGCIEHRSGQGCSWLDQRPPPNDQSKFRVDSVDSWLMCTGFDN